MYGNLHISTYWYFPTIKQLLEDQSPFVFWVSTRAPHFWVGPTSVHQPTTGRWLSKSPLSFIIFPHRCLEVSNPWGIPRNGWYWMASSKNRWMLWGYPWIPPFWETTILCGFPIDYERVVSRSLSLLVRAKVRVPQYAGAHLSNESGWTRCKMR